jgi:hypothetical protein
MGLSIALSIQVGQLNSRRTQMADDPSKRGPSDRARINVNQDYEVEYWCRKLGITPHELRLLVQQHGTSAEKIREVLGQEKTA